MLAIEYVQIGGRQIAIETNRSVSLVLLPMLTLAPLCIAGGSSGVRFDLITTTASEGPVFHAYNNKDRENP